MCSMHVVCRITRVDIQLSLGPLNFVGPLPSAQRAWFRIRHSATHWIGVGASRHAIVAWVVLLGIS